MTTRQFDPVFSAALRNELESLVDVQEPEPARGLLPTLRKPQVWISIVTAVVLVAATIGVLQVTRGSESDPAGGSRIVDPLRSVTDPNDGQYVARRVQVLLHVRAAGPGTHDFAVPTGVTSMRMIVNCAPSGQYGLGIDGDGANTGGCEKETRTSIDVPVKPGIHAVEVTVETGTAYALLIIASPAPTVSAGPLIDPLTEVRNLRNPDALVGDTRPLLRESARTGDAAAVAFQVPAGVGRVRAYFVCAPSSARAELAIGGRTVIGCMNSIAHWFDLSPSTRSIVTRVSNPGNVPWSLLVVRAPAGAKDSPPNALLPLPPTDGQHVLAQARGVGNQVVGTLPGTKAAGIDLSVTCRGSGWLEIATSQGTIGRGSDCLAQGRFATGIGGSAQKPAPYTVTPHGDISWTVTISDAG